ncbi:MBL fold metallo-hydrolase [Rhizobium sp. TRM95111]|uniref:MBL fold metallo-hydrolase n=1 Tax=Rhizobium alarense TaxID=2846851 RepID=UPI001F38038D|nr:MBL fold metallo-hydrolase [Rhizobium alarense]MCF3642659.1 MBL fold metallo-hydrolase [Rhizobium alarense]
MTPDRFVVRFWGVRGSVPVSGPQFQRYGGNTICVEMRCGSDVLLFDAGSGIPCAGHALRAEGVERIDLLFTHCHYDHILGFPYFKPMYDSGTSVKLWSGHLAGAMTTHEMIEGFMRPPWFPVGPSICRANLEFGDFRAGDVLQPRPAITVRTGPLNHPGGAIGYRVEWNGRAVALITDTEHVPGILDPNVLSLIEGCDLFIYDACYTEEEMQLYRGFGHSTWQQAVKLAQAAGAKRAAFIHHAPWRTDDELDAMDRAATAVFGGAFHARDRQELEL